jgi:hypothetical protein
VKRLLTLSLLVLGCGSTAGGSGDSGRPTNVRATRYCEILVGFIQGTQIHVDVYNTEGLNDCPTSEWAAVDTSQVQADFGADIAMRNGPRYWMIDSFGSSTLLDPTTKQVGGIEMRRAGGIDAALGDLASLQKAYALHTINRNSEFIFLADKPVYELVDPSGHVYTMQSYSTQQKPLTVDALAGLGAQLTLPAGWSYRTRTLTADLDVRAPNGKATVVQDDFENTYLQSK